MNFYPRPPRGGRRAKLRRETHEMLISIHALCEEGDRTTSATTSCVAYFYPRPLRGGRRAPAVACALRPANFYPRPLRGGRPLAHLGRNAHVVFLSTPSARRATTILFLFCQEVFDFYPRPLRGGRPASRYVQARHLVISIHALCEEGDSEASLHTFTPPLFLSTPSARRATASNGGRTSS